MKARISETGTLMWWCPGCLHYHGAATDSSSPNPVTGAKWQWNGSLESPTLSPSVLVHPHETVRAEIPDGLSGVALTQFLDAHRVMTPRCHCFVRDGQIEFCGDSEHELAGKTVEMIDDEEV